MRGKIASSKTRSRHLLKCIELASERISTGVSIAKLAKRHRLSEMDVREYIDQAIRIARIHTYETAVNSVPAVNDN